MKILITQQAAAAWRRGQTVMSGPVTFDLPHWPVRLRGCWVESSNPETHRVSGMTRVAGGEAARRYLDEIDRMLAEGAIDVIPPL